MLRPLGSFEQAWALSHEIAAQTFVNVVCLSPSVDPERLRQVLIDLQRAQPLLGVGLEKRGSAYAFKRGQDRAIPLDVLERGDDEHWVEVVEGELHRQLPTAVGPLLHVTLLAPPQGSDACEIVLTWHHAIIDGEGATYFLHALLEACMRDLDDDHPAQEPQTILPSSDDLFPPPFQGAGLSRNLIPFVARTFAGEMGYTLRRAGKRKPPIHAQAKNKVLLLRLDPQTTSELIRQTREKGLTLNSALNAAMLLAVWRQLYQSEPGLHRGISFTELRPYLKPPVPGESLGCYNSMLRYTLALQKDQDFWETTRQIHHAIYRGAKRGEKYLMARVSKDVMRMTFQMKAFRMGTIGLSYAGPIGLEQRYGDVEVVGVHAFVSNFGVGPELTGTIFLSQGELHWDMLYLDTDLEPAAAESLVAEIRTLIQNACSKA